MRGVLGVLMSGMLVCAPVVSASSAAPIGRVSTKGIVQVNREATPTGGTLFSGDRITTQQNALAEVSLAGGTQMFLSQQTEAQFALEENALRVVMARGDLALVDRHGQPVLVEVRGVHVQTAAGKAGVFEVMWNDGKLRVLAHKGTTMVRAGEQVFEVKEGTMLESSLDPAPQGPAGTGAVSLRAIILPLAIAGGIAGLALALLLTSETCRTVSPAGEVCTP